MGHSPASINNCKFTTSSRATREELAALVMLRRLRAHGVEYFFCNPGTDFPAIVEAFSMAEADPELARSLPKPVVVLHENAAVAMAHGVYLSTGKPQAVMVHVNVGTANTVNGAANANRDNAPILLMAGRTPITETGLHGSRSRNIHWAQEMFDQAGMLREFVKWDYELKVATETESAVDRAMELMMSSPRGPAYLSLPREVISSSISAMEPKRIRAVAGAPWPQPEAVEALAALVAKAKRPLIVTSTSGRTRAGFDALSALTQKYAIGVITLSGRYVCLPTSHDMHLGFQTQPFIQDADLIIVLECDVPWIPSLENPPVDCKVVHVAEDPAFSRYPTRAFPVDLAIRADATVALQALGVELAKLLPETEGEAPSIAERRSLIATRRKALRARWAAQADKASQAAHITPEQISRRISDIVGPDAIIVNEYPLRLEHVYREQSGSFLGQSPAGGLGWGLGAALGVKLACPDKVVVATLGDGAYVFDNPTACHWVSAVQKLPVLVIIYNNQMYGAVRNSTAAMYKDGMSGNNNCMLLADLSPSPAFEKIAEASGGYGERVEDPSQLEAAMVRALHAVTHEKRQALLNVVCKY
ncbi:thiamine pyrophosphate-requiring protein [Polaromonas sp.]|uniref:thiamine pyrophosphate-requiring protein n=1 Tax=Polaromonas sp. TaxID=1869339 RepID=UPI003BAC439E